MELIDRLRKPAIWLLIAIGLGSLVARLIAIWQLPMIGDEPVDLAIIAWDLRKVSLFFSGVPAPDAGRLSFEVAPPIAAIYRSWDALIPLRLLFLGFHLAYFFFCYKLILEETRRKSSALVYVLLGFTSCYLAGLSFWILTAGDQLYLLLHVICIYYFRRSYKGEGEEGGLRNYLMLTLFLGLCTASKLWGVFLIVSFFIFYCVNQNPFKRVRIGSVSPVKVIGVSVIFLAVLVAVNVASIGAMTKLFCAVGASWLYLMVFISWLIQEHRRKFKGSAANGLLIWVALTISTFCLLLVFSPVFLNLTNIVRVFDFPKAWYQGAIVANAYWHDIPVIMIVKFGLVSCGMLLLATLVFLRSRIGKKRMIAKNSFAMLMALVFIVHFCVITSVKHKGFWYPLAIFPFLYLPFVWMWNEAENARSPRKIIAAAFCILVVLLDNGYRYIRWFPYTHLDGAQYGNYFIGWNKPAGVTYEAMPALL